MSKYPWLLERTILLAEVGSYAYGTNTPDSDRDYKGICIPPIEYYLGLQSFNEYNSAGGKNFKNAKNDIDVTISHLTKFALNAMKGVPNNIELLFIEKSEYIKLTSLGEMLVDHRHLFLSKRLEAKYRGYAKSQLDKLRKSQKHDDDPLVRQYGYNTKLLMHTVRLLTSAIEILETGDFQTRRPNREQLLACRNGKYSLQEAFDMIEYYDQQLQQALFHTTLPDAPDETKINSLVIEINKKGALNDSEWS